MTETGPLQLTLFETDRADGTLSRAIARFTSHCHVAKSLSNNTLRAYCSDLEDFVMHRADLTEVSQVNHEGILQYVRAMRERALKPTTIKRRLAALRSLFKWLEHEKQIPRSVFHELDLSIRLPGRLPRALGGADTRLLLLRAEYEARRPRLRDPYEALLVHFVLVTLFVTGLRIGELMAVRLPEISAHDGGIKVRGKGNRERRVYLTGITASNLLIRFLQARRRIHTTTDRVFVWRNSSCVTAQQIRMELRCLARKAGVSQRVTPHMLRHTAATQLLEAGVDIRFVQKLLGHSSIATTQIYTHVTDVALRSKLMRANTLKRIFKRA